MTEFALYANLTVPQLALETVLPALSWLPGDVANYAARSSATSFEIFETILNILLVFAGARTSALLGDLRPDYAPFIDRLNDALSGAGQNPFRLQVEEFYMGDFIFRENNPLFIDSRRHRLGHKEVGHNLDMYAPANIDNLMNEEKLFIHTIETYTWTPVTAEVVYNRCMGSDEDMERLVAFTEDKVSRFNNAFDALNLPYRFQWSFGLSSKEIEQVLSSNIPPSSEWWRRHWHEIALPTVGYRSHLPHIFTTPEKHWNVITTLWCFQKSNAAWTLRDDNFRERVETILSDVNNHIARGIPVDIDGLRLKLAKLDAERSMEIMKVGEGPIILPVSPRSEAWKTLKRILVAEFRYLVQGSKKPTISVKSIGVDCSPLEDHYWSSLFERIVFLTGLTIFG